MGLKKVYVHCLLDGRDVPPTSGADFVAECERKLKEIGVGKIATVMGRYYAMDRDNRWERVEKAYAAMVYGEGNQAEDPVAAIRTSYQEIDAEGKNITDEFVVPTVCSHDADARIMANDSVIFFNFRPDRAREITRTLVDPELSSIGEQQRIIGLVVAVSTRPASRQNARSVTHHIDDETESSATAGRPVRMATARALSSTFSWKVTPVSTGSGR